MFVLWVHGPLILGLESEINSCLWHPNTAEIPTNLSTQICGFKKEQNIENQCFCLEIEFRRKPHNQSRNTECWSAKLPETVRFLQPKGGQNSINPIDVVGRVEVERQFWFTDCPQCSILDCFWRFSVCFCGHGRGYIPMLETISGDGGLQQETGNPNGSFRWAYRKTYNTTKYAALPAPRFWI